jgi:hypothetical protein
MRVKHQGRGKTILLETAAIAGLLLGMGLLVLKKPGRRTTHLNRVAIAQIRGKAAALIGTRYDQYAPKNYR